MLQQIIFGVKGFSAQHAPIRQQRCRFTAEIAPVTVPSRKGDMIVEKDEYTCRNVFNNEPLSADSPWRNAPILC